MNLRTLSRPADALAAQRLRQLHQRAQFMRGPCGGKVVKRGTSNARLTEMTQRHESWTIPLQVIMITTLVVGLVMVMAVVLMN